MVKFLLTIVTIIVLFLITIWKTTVDIKRLKRERLIEESISYLEILNGSRNNEYKLKEVTMRARMIEIENELDYLKNKN